MYRPQFAYLDAPPDTRDCRVTYSFDLSNTVGFQGLIPNNNLYTTPIPLALDPDADFFIRAIQVYGPNLGIALLDPFSRQMVQPLSPGFPGTLNSELWASSDGACPVAMESDNWGIFCPAGSSLTCYVQNTSGSSVAGPVITLHGIKRYCGWRVKCQ